VEEVADTVAAAMGGREAGQLFEGDRRFDVVVRVPRPAATTSTPWARLPVMLPEEPGGRGRSVPLRRSRSSGSPKV
jgi:cobalt-zinc-cadmium resistance protein CzcA